MDKLLHCSIQSIMNKYSCMSPQFRNFNDANTIIHWSNAMLHVNTLLLQPHEADNLHTLLPPIEPARKSYDVLTLSHSNTLCFLPTSEPSHTLSRMHNSNFEPQPTSPLSIFKPRELSIPRRTHFSASDETSPRWDNSQLASGRNFW